MINVDALVAAVERSPALELPCVVWVKLDQPQPLDVREVSAMFAVVTERTGGRVHFITTCGPVELSAAAEVSEHDLVTALLAERSRPSVQQQAAKLREQFVIIPRASLGASLTKL